ERRDETPPACVSAETVRKQQRRFLPVRGVPRQVVDRRVVHFGKTRLGGRGNRPREPLGNVGLIGHAQLNSVGRVGSRWCWCMRRICSAFERPVDSSGSASSGKNSTAV